MKLFYMVASRGRAISIPIAIVMTMVFGFAAPCLADDWPQWRGPSGMGISLESDLPTRWGAEENIVWTADLAGRGASTPIISGERIFVTSQIGAGDVEMRAVGGSGIERGGTAVVFVVECLDRASGELLWQYRFEAQGELTPVHPNHNMASPSCVTDGERVVAWFASGQAVCLDLEGGMIWERNIAREHSSFALLWGHASSPALHDDFLYLLCDHDPEAFLLALDKRTGETRWKAMHGEGLRSYSTPLVIDTGSRRELIVNSNPGLTAHDPETGAVLWRAGEFCKVPVPTPVFADGVIYTSRGYSSGPYMAIRPGGAGDVSESHLLWRVPTGAPYVSSLLHYQGLLYMGTERGVVRCIEPATGETVWEQRLGGNFSASPVGADGKVYFLNEGGETFVLAAGRTCEVISRNALDEVCRASPAISGGRIFIRSDSRLFCIGE